MNTLLLPGRFSPAPWALCCFLALMAPGCMTPGDAPAPEVNAPPDWRWKSAEPRDEVPKGAWWRVFDDQQLNELQELAWEYNQNVKAAAARVEQARASARISRSEFYPSLSAAPVFSRYRTSGNAPSPVGFPIESFIAQEWRTPFDLSYELDLWGRVRSEFNAARQTAIAAEAARQNALLLLQADVALNYFALAGIEAEVRALEEAIELRGQALSIFEQRLEAGVGTEFQVERTRVELATAQADLSAALRRREEIKNALTLLCGQPPGEVTIQTPEELPSPPVVAPDLPSSLLERRPDIARAERELAAALARIDIARKAFFPSVRLTASGGFQSGELSDLFKWNSRTWGISPSIDIPIFSGGRWGASKERTRAAYEEAVANYRQQALVAFHEVDDSLAALRFLDEQIEARREATRASRRSAEISLERFSAGSVNFLEVVDAESARLRNELLQIRVVVERLQAAVRLIKALGGGWDEPGGEAMTAENLTIE